MKVIDPRNGIELAIGQTSSYPDGESVTLLEVDPGMVPGRDPAAAAKFIVEFLAESMPRAVHD